MRTYFLIFIFENKVFLFGGGGYKICHREAMQRRKCHDKETGELHRRRRGCVHLSVFPNLMLPRIHQNSWKIYGPPSIPT